MIAHRDMMSISNSWHGEWGLPFFTIHPKVDECGDERVGWCPHLQESEHITWGRLLSRNT